MAKLVINPSWLPESSLCVISTDYARSKKELAIVMLICDRICQKGLMHAITNIEKSRFKILNTVYLENAWCLVYEILHQSIAIQDNLVGVLLDGLLAELPAILDGFFTSTTSDYIGVVGWGWWGATKWRGNTRCVVTLVLWIQWCLN